MLQFYAKHAMMAIKVVQVFRRPLSFHTQLAYTCSLTPYTHAA